MSNHTVTEDQQADLLALTPDGVLHDPTPRWVWTIRDAHPDGRYDRVVASALGAPSLGWEVAGYASGAQAFTVVFSHGTPWLVVLAAITQAVNP